MKTRMLLLFASVFIYGISLSQTGQISGTVVDEETGEPLPFVNVLLKEAKTVVAGSSTDFDGNFLMKNIPPGVYRITASYVGYKPYQQDSVLVEAGQRLVDTIRIKSTGVQLESFEVVAYKVPLISKDQTTSGATITASDLGGVRGGRSSSNVMYIDGIRVRGSKDVRSNDRPYDSRSYSSAGRLTATELNDFSKWSLWSDISKQDLREFRTVWGITPDERYMVQVTDESGGPVIDAKVCLRQKEGGVEWVARTDNTGKAEMWNQLFGRSEQTELEIAVFYEGQEYNYARPHLYSSGINSLQLPVKRAVPGNVEIAFVVDATGSMEDEITFLQSDLIEIIEKIRQGFPDLEISLGSVFYKCFDNSYATKTSPLNSNIKRTAEFIAKQSAGEGGDEVVEEALAAAVDDLGWSDRARTRIIFFVLDEQPLTSSDVIRKMKKYVALAADKGIRIVPVVASAETIEHAQSLEYLMRSVALATNGTYVALTDDSGIGGTHAKPVTDSYDVELLNDLLKRIIFQYCYVPEDSQEKSSEDTLVDSVFVSKKKILKTSVADSLRTKKEVSPATYAEIFHMKREVVQLDSVTVMALQDQERTKRQNRRSAIPEVKVYPNPTSGIFRVQSEGTVKEVYLFDISGKLLLKVVADDRDELEVDISNFSSGTYFLKFESEGRWNSSKVILNH